ncbi:hypothetical protein CVT24_009953 [Panaeolus cyanescens]|uniref:Ricin B lectin domain-containing protein n=1 Tax=Panaeolus cyanescens TaxID=181874 RepID=A0A409W420_9AGAR|nr:hypothetical protein CVT24_009953 [Panaeolus cyanescens]
MTLFITNNAVATIPAGGVLNHTAPDGNFNVGTDSGAPPGTTGNVGQIVAGILSGTYDGHYLFEKTPAPFYTGIKVTPKSPVNGQFCKPAICNAQVCDSTYESQPMRLSPTAPDAPTPPLELCPGTPGYNIEFCPGGQFLNPNAGVPINPNGNKSKCLDVRGAVFQNGTPVQIYDCNGTNAQKWVLKRGIGAIQLAGTNFCLDSSTNAANHNKMKIWQCYPGIPAQTWSYERFMNRVKRVGSAVLCGPQLTVRNKCPQAMTLFISNNAVATIPAGGVLNHTAPDSNFYVGTDSGAPAGTTGTVGQIVAGFLTYNGYYLFEKTPAPFYTGIKVAPKSPVNGQFCKPSICNAQVCDSTYEGEPRRLSPVAPDAPTPPLELCHNNPGYDIEFCPGGQFLDPNAGVPINPNGNKSKCLDVRGAVFQNGTPVQIYDCNGTNAQKWLIKRGIGAIQVAGTNFCLDSSTDAVNHNKMKIWQCYPGIPAQTWSFERFMSKIKRVGSENQCLDLPNGGLWNTNVVETYQCYAFNTNQMCPRDLTFFINESLVATIPAGGAFNYPGPDNSFVVGTDLNGSPPGTTGTVGQIDAGFLSYNGYYLFERRPPPFYTGIKVTPKSPISGEFCKPAVCNGQVCASTYKGVPRKLAPQAPDQPAPPLELCHNNPGYDVV